MSAFAEDCARRERSAEDSSTFSNPARARSVHVDLDWTVDFDAKVISGSCTHTVKVLTAGVEHVAFDSRDLSISSVTVNGQAAPLTEGKTDKALGTQLLVAIPDGLRSEGEELRVQFVYRQSSDASAVQWLDKEQTKGGAHPYVFTQCQAIHARSLLPCQDGPGVKITYSAKVAAPAWCTVLMSAVADDSQGGAPGVFVFTQPVPMAAYLIALAAGQLASREISPRVRVWAEPDVVEAVAYEFAETEAFLTAAEDLAGPYRWGRYDVLCLPPSFPYGGMENPCLTFATPTLLAGDRSLADVIAHEIAHSWTGNLVTNATWDHFWLNEGWTVWLERKIMSRVQSVEYFKLSAQVGWKALKDSVTALGADSPFTQLVWPLDGADPDDAFSSVPYEKGFNLLYSLELIVGRERFEAFAKAYIAHFQPGTATSGQFKDFFLQHFADVDGEAALELAQFDWRAAFFARGMPARTPNFANSLSTAAEALARVWITHAMEDKLPAYLTADDMKGWNSKQTCIFLETLLLYVEAEDTEYALSEDCLRAMDALYHFSASGNSEIKFRWQSLCLLSEMDWIVPHVVAFLSEQGRMKYVRPLYRKLHVFKAEVAKENFQQKALSYHPIARKMLAVDLGLNL